MFDSNNSPSKNLDEIKAELLEAHPEDLKDIQLYVKLKRIKSPWHRALIGFVVDVLIFISPLVEALPRKR